MQNPKEFKSQAFMAYCKLMEPCPYLAEQGVEIGRHGKVQVKFERSKNHTVSIFVGGSAVKLIEAHLYPY